MLNGVFLGKLGTQTDTLAVKTIRFLENMEKF